MFNPILATTLFELRTALRHRPLWWAAAVLPLGTYFLLTSRLVPQVTPWDLRRDVWSVGILFVNFLDVVLRFAGIGVVAVIMAIFITLDLGGRHRRKGLENVTFTKPVSSLQLQLGRFSAVAMILAFLSTLPMLVIAYFYSRHRYYDWQWKDMVTLWALGLLWPMLVSGAVAWLAAGVFRSVLIASAFSLLVPVLFLLPWPLEHFSPYWFLARAPGFYYLPLGFHIPGGVLWHQLTGNVLLTLMLIVASCYYLRRRTPDFSAPPAGRLRWVDTPTFREIFQSLIPDRAVGRDAGVSLLGVFILVMVFLGWNSARSLSERSRWQAWEQQWLRLGDQYEPPGPSLMAYRGPATPEGLRVSHYDLALTYDPTRNHLHASCQLAVANEGAESVTEIPLLLNVGLDVKSAHENRTGDFTPLAYEKVFNLVRLRPQEALLPGSTCQLRLAYEGPLIQGMRRRKTTTFSERRFDSPVWFLTEEDLFYPVLPVTRATKGDRANLRQRFFTASVQVNIEGQPGAIAFGPGEPSRNRLETGFPLSRLLLVAGPFREQRQVIEGLPVRMMSLPGREQIAALFLEDIQWLVRDTLRELGEFPYPQLVVYDSVTQQLSGPGLIPVSLDAMFQTKVYSDAFRQRFRRSLDRSRYFVYATDADASTVHQALLDSYFLESVYPVGRLAVLLSRYLPEYVKGQLRPGWRLRQSYSRQYDVPLNQKAMLLRPLREMLAENDHAPQTRLKATALFHMLRYLLGEDGFRQLLQAYLERYRFQDVRWQDFQRLAGEIAGNNLEWFFRQWIQQPALPEYVLERAEAEMCDDPQTLGMDYRVTIEVVNEGTGQMRVPIYLKTEGDDILQDVMLHTGERQRVMIEVPDRPLYASIDPQGWILQGQHYYEKGLVGRIERRVEILPYRPQPGKSLP